MRRPPMLVRFALPVILSIASAGCLSVLPEPDAPIALLELPDSRATAPDRTLDTDVVVYAPDSNRAFAGINIPVRDEQELVFLSDIRWADAAPRLLQEAVVNALSKGSGEGRAATAELATRGDYDLRWRIIDMSVTRNAGPVTVTVQASLVRTGSRRVVAQDRFSSSLTPASGAARVRAATLAQAAQDVADDVAAFVAVNATGERLATDRGRP